MFKTVAFIRSSVRGWHFDMLVTVPWPDITNEAMRATLELSGKSIEDTLHDMGFSDAARLLDDFPKMRMRARFNMCDEFVFDSDFNPSEHEVRAAIEAKLDGYEVKQFREVPESESLF